MASKRQDSTTSSEEDGERALFTRNVENVEKAKRGLFEQAARRTRGYRLYVIVHEFVT